MCVTWFLTMITSIIVFSYNIALKVNVIRRSKKKKLNIDED